VRLTAMTIGPPASRQHEVSCPTCAGRAVYSAANRWRPFCSEHCRMVDLGAWASERFRVVEASAPADPAGLQPPLAADDH